MASRGEAREHVTNEKPYHKKHGNRCIVPLPLSSFQGFVSFRSTIFRFVMTNRFVKDCRVGRTRPPRNDKIDRLDRKHGTQNPIFGFRKTSLICCLILTVPDFLDSLKRPRDRMSPGGAAVYAGICARLISGSSQPRLSVGFSAGLFDRCVRPELQPGFTADAFGRFFSRASRRPWNRRT